MGSSACTLPPTLACNIERQLVGHGASLRGEGYLGTPLGAAAQGHAETIKFLLDSGTDMSATGRPTKCLLSMLGASPPCGIQQ